mgnify:CR=1 FL=1
MFSAPVLFSDLESLSVDYTAVEGGIAGGSPRIVFVTDTDDFFFVHWGPAGSFVVPARTARLRVTQTVSRVTDAIATARLVFDIAGTTAITKQESATTFNSMAVWTTRPNRVRDVETDYRRLAEESQK